MKVFDALIGIGKVIGTANPIVGLVASGIECIVNQFGDDPKKAADEYKKLGTSYIKLGLAMLEAAEDGEITEQELNELRKLKEGSDETGNQERTDNA